jgi:hypothetical protein
MHRHLSLRLIPRLLAVLALSAPVAAGAALWPSPAAAASCHRDGCNGQDPQAAGCDADAYNIASFRYGNANPYLQGAWMELRYSPACDAAWARATEGDCFGMWRPCGFALEIAGGEAQQSVSGGPGPGQRWSAMWSFRQYVRACFTAYSKDGSSSPDGCTAWS